MKLLLNKMKGIERKMDVIGRKLDKVLEQIEILQGGVNVRSIQADTPKAYGLALLDVSLRWKNWEEASYLSKAQTRPE